MKSLPELVAGGPGHLHNSRDLNPVFRSIDPQHPSCALAVVMDHYWIQAVDPRYVTTLDVSDPGRPREVARLELEPKDDPHWLAREPYGRRIVITGGSPLKTDGLFGRVLIASVGVDGKITLDPRLKDPAMGKAGIRLDRASAHGAVLG